MAFIFMTETIRMFSFMKTIKKTRSTIDVKGLPLALSIIDANSIWAYGRYFALGSDVHRYNLG